MIQAVAAMVIMRNTHSAQLNMYRVLCMRTGRFVSSYEKPKLSALGKRCKELVEQDRNEMRTVIYNKRVAELKARGITHPSQLLKYTFGMFMGKVRY